MRTALVMLACAAAWAQPTPPPPIPGVPGVIQPLYRLVNDYGNLARYAEENRKVQPPAPGEDRVVFMGDSITDFWGRRAGTFFPEKPYINRGISGQVTAQMLVRFHRDVVQLKPRAVVILAGTNDIGGNLGPATNEQIADNLMAMVEMARGNNIKLVLSTLTPVCDYHQPQTQTRPPARIVALNQWIREYASKNGVTLLDYYPAMIDEQQMLRRELTGDGLHPNAAGYDVMMPLAAKAIASALGK
jgi:lysophospholipase L1-like esterase